MNSSNKISQFGYNFQIKLIVSLMTERAFLEQIYDVLDEKYFDNDAIKWIIKQCREYFKEYKSPITFDVFKINTDSIENDVIKTTVISTLREVYRYLDAPDLDFIKDKSIDFFKNQMLKNAIIQSVDILETHGDFEEIKKLIDDALKAGVEKNIGHEYLTMIEERYSEMVRNTISTPWDVINELIQGGLGGGELGVIVSPSGGGKSWVLSSIGANAVKNGLTVIHYSLELNEGYTGLRYDSVLTGIANQNLKYHKDDVVSTLSDMGGELFIKYFPPKTASVNTISAHLQRLETLGKSVDMVIVDYADEMRDTKYTKEVRHALGNIYSDLRGVAGEFQIPIWTASQAGRAALEDDFIEAQRVAESYQKVMVSDFVMSLSRKVEDKIGNTGRFHIIKNRFGPDGLTYPAMVNTNTGQVNIYDGASVDGKAQQKKINNRDNLMKKVLASKYEDLMEDD